MPTANAPPNRGAPARHAELRLLLVSAEELFNLGGVGMVVQQLIQQLPARFHVSVAWPGASRDKLPAAFRERVENTVGVRSDHWSEENREEFLAQVRRAQYDLVNFHGGMYSFDAHVPWRSPVSSLGRAGVPWINTNHCTPGLTAGLFAADYPFYLKAPKFALAYFAKAYLLARCQREVMVSGENARRLARWFPWARSKLTTIYPARLEGEAPPPAFRDPVRTIGNLGHLGWRKGQHDLLSAFGLLARKHPQLELVLAGPELEPDCPAWLRAEISRLGLQRRVHLPGGLADVREFWREVDIYVQPSHYEGAPMALMEALWHSKPAVGTRVSGIPEIIDDGVTGLLVEPKAPAALAAALERLIANPRERQRFGAAGPARIAAKGMTGPQMIQRYVALYEEVLAKTQRGRAPRPPHR